MDDPSGGGGAAGDGEGADAGLVAHLGGTGDGRGGTDGGAGADGGRGGDAGGSMGSRDGGGGTGSPTNDAAPLPAQDFNARCADPSVLRCYGFDDSADAVQYIAHASSAGTQYAGVVNDVRASGAGSLRFVVPPNSSDGTSGAFAINFTPDLSYLAGPGMDYYVQWRQRFDAPFLDPNFGGNGFKQAIFADGDLPPSAANPGGFIGHACSDDEIVMENSAGRGIPQMYHSCGVKDGQYEPLQVYNSPRNPGRYELQNGLNPACLWQAVAEPPCMMYRADEWMTFQVHVHVGTWYLNDHVYHHDSVIQMWVAHEGQPSKLTIDFSPASDSGGYDLVNTAPYRNYGKVWLLPYRTNKTPSQANPLANTWYDELIISRSRIADPT
jgi:hypothetical protein